MEKLMNTVKDAAPVELPADIPGGVGDISGLVANNPLTGGMSDMITGQLMSPPTVYYIMAFAFVMLVIIGTLIWLVVSVRKLKKGGYATSSVNQAYNSLNQTSMPQGSLGVGYTWPDGSPMTEKEYTLEQKALNKRGMWHLLRTFARVVADPKAIRVGKVGLVNSQSQPLQGTYQNQGQHLQQFDPNGYPHGLPNQGYPQAVTPQGYPQAVTPQGYYVNQPNQQFDPSAAVPQGTVTFPQPNQGQQLNYGNPTDPNGQHPQASMGSNVVALTNR